MFSESSTWQLPLTPTASAHLSTPLFIFTIIRLRENYPRLTRLTKSHLLPAQLTRILSEPQQRGRWLVTAGYCEWSSRAHFKYCIWNYYWGRVPLYNWYYNRGKYTFRVSSNFIVESEISIFYVDHKTLTLMEMIRDVIKIVTESRDVAPEQWPAAPRIRRHCGHHCYGTSGRSRAPLRSTVNNRASNEGYPKIRKSFTITEMAPTRIWDGQL